jgi:ABC-type branched-subunit amino acid transport system ATPase component/ABC-type branched-subunit amino acid transport system permease subunit
MSRFAPFREGLHDVRRHWTLRTTLTTVALVVAAFVPLVTGDARLADLASGLYLACAAVALGLVAGVAGLPSLAQGAFMATGAIVAAHLLEHGAPTGIAALAGAVAGGAAGAIVAGAFIRLPRAGFAAATWIVSWLVALAVVSVTWLLGGAQGTVVSGGPTTTGHYELALGLTALAVLGFAALARSPFGLGLAAAREREPAAAALGVPFRRWRTIAVTASATVAGLAGALAVQLAVVADPASYGPYLSFKLFVMVLVGGALAPAGAVAGAAVLGILSVAADAIGSLENVSATRAHELLTAIMLLGVVSLGWEGLIRPAKRRRFGAGTAPARPQGRGLEASGLVKRYDALVAADDVSVAAEPHTVTALIGPNGSGKTTVLRMLAGTIAPDAGHIDGGDAAVRTLQATSVFPSLTPLEHLLVASVGRRTRAGFFRSLLATPQHRAEDAAFVAEAETILARFELPRDGPAGELSAGDQRVLMLAAAYATGAPVLLVDEPTAGASATEAARVAELLRELRGEGLALIVVEHNLGVVRRLADHVVVLDAGRVVAAGTPDDVAHDERAREAYLGRHAL